MTVLTNYILFHSNITKVGSNFHIVLKSFLT
jgi:hypothetical protein